MEKINARGVSDGIAIGKIHVIDRKQNIDSNKSADTNLEHERLDAGLKKAAEALEQIKENIGGDEKEIFTAHQLMLEDPELIGTINSYIDQGFKAEYSVFQAKEDLKEIFYAMDDEYFRMRANDIEDVMTRLIKALQGEEAKTLDDDYILLADDLYPSETMEMDFKKIKGLATINGSVTSHTTILANNLKIPAVISLAIDDFVVCDNKLAIIDGSQGIFILDPSDETIEEYREKINQNNLKAKDLSKYKNMEAITHSGQRISVYANIGSDEEAKDAYENGAEGIGLFRSEFLFLGKDNAPDEETQFEAYKNALEYMKGRPVTIRTLDIGADKQVDYLGLEKEDNPQMGLRAIRISLSQTDLFKTQLRALLRASVYGKLKILLPMIISADEIIQTKNLIEECKSELDKESKAYGDIELGIMIETPAACIIADELAKECDFFSIGTNDLTSYTLAVDRTNARLSAYLDSHHQAILRLIKMAALAAHENKIEVGICGAAGADLSLLDYFIEIGIDELSVPVGRVLDLKKEIINRQ